jgi:hypothetical protein
VITELSKRIVGGFVERAKRRVANGLPVNGEVGVEHTSVFDECDRWARMESRGKLPRRDVLRLQRKR